MPKEKSVFGRKTVFTDKAAKDRLGNCWKFSGVGGVVNDRG